jgi:putative ABC transport system permease protein
LIYREYLFAELRRRKARTILTALGLGVGVGLVVMVGALSKGLDKAQAEVLAPLTGIGTDMTVTRPINPGQGGQGLSSAERKRLQSEAGPPRVGLQNLGDPGEKFTRETFMTAGNLSFDSDEVASVTKIDGVKSASAGLTVQLTTITGTVPETTSSAGGLGGGPPAGGGAAGGPGAINFTSTSVTGVDPAAGDLGPIQADQLAKGKYFTSGDVKEAVFSASYAKSKGLTVGDSVNLHDHKYKIVGIVSAPLGGSASDIYIKLDQLQSIAGMKGRVNTMYVRADSTGDVDAVSAAIKTNVESASVTTSKTLADRVGGSVVDARKLAQKLGLALEIAALVAAILIAVLLTLTAVSKRTRELGTLKAIGWSRGRVVNQVVGESVAQGVLGGVVGVIIGGLGALAISAFGLTMKASVAAASTNGGFGGGPAGGGGPGLVTRGTNAIVSGTETVTVDAPLNLQLIIAAVLLAVLGGAIAGGAGGLRAARLSPAEALRQVD